MPRYMCVSVLLEYSTNSLAFKINGDMYFLHPKDLLKSKETKLVGDSWTEEVSILLSTVFYFTELYFTVL